MRRYQGRSDELNDYYLKNVELLYWDQGFRVDDELKSLGLRSNRQIETLSRLIELLDNRRHAEAARRVLARYTCESFETPPQWRQWFEASRTRIYFTDVGGYKFLVAPEGYVIRPKNRNAEAQTVSP